MKFKDLEPGDYFYYKIGNFSSGRCVKTQPIEKLDGFTVNTVVIFNGTFSYVGPDTEVVQA